MYQEIHPCRAGSIGSVKINTSLLMMREWTLFDVSDIIGHLKKLPLPPVVEQRVAETMNISLGLHSLETTIFILLKSSQILSTIVILLKSPQILAAILSSQILNLDARRIGFKSRCQILELFLFSRLEVVTSCFEWKIYLSSSFAPVKLPL